MIITRKLTITGKVQGVWYRASAKDKALELSLTGKVWNETNGDVGAIVTGDEKNVQRFIDWCYQGPPLSNVESVSVEEMDQQEFKGFEITKKG